MRVLYLGLWLVTDFVFFKSSFRLFFVFFNRFAFLQVLHCHYQSQASSMPSKEEWFTYDTTVFLHLNNHIHNQRREKKWKKTKKWWTFTAHNGNSNHHLQPLLRVPLVFLLLMCHTDLSSFSDRGHSSSEREESVSNARCHITVNGNSSTFVVFASDRIHRFCTLSILL